MSYHKLGLCRFVLHDLDIPCSYILSSLSLTGFLELSQVLGYGSLQLVPPITEGSLYDDSLGVYQSDGRGKPVQAPSQLLLGFLTEVILGYSW